MRLIDIENFKPNPKYTNEMNDAILAQMFRQPIIDAEPVRHGRIIEFWDNTYHPRKKFSCCDTECTTLTMWAWPKYCPYCGAKLDEETEGENNGL